MMIHHELYRIAEVCYERGQWRKALQIFIKILEEVPDYLAVQRFQIECLIKLGEFKNALEIIDTTIKKYPNNTDLLEQKCECLIALSRIQEAKDLAKSLLLMRKDDQSYKEINKIMNDPTYRTADHKKHLADMLLKPHNFPPAAHPNKVGKYPINAIDDGNYFYDELLEYRIWIHKHKGSDDCFYFKSYVEALKFYVDQSIQKNSGYSEIDYIEQPLALVLNRPLYNTEKREMLPGEIGGDICEIHLDDLEGRDIATGKFPQYYAKTYNNKIYWVNRGNIHLQLNDLESALACFEQSLKFDGQYPYGYLGKAIVLFLQGKTKDAIGTIDKGILVYKEKYNKVLDDIEELIVKNHYPILLSLLYFHKGNLLASINENESAILMYEEASRLDPHNYHIHAMHAEILKRLEYFTPYNNMIKQAMAEYQHYVPYGSKLYITPPDTGKDTTIHKTYDDIKKQVPDIGRFTIDLEQNDTQNEYFLKLAKLIATLQSAYKSGFYSRVIQYFNIFQNHVSKKDFNIKLIPEVIFMIAYECAIRSYVQRERPEDRREAIKIGQDLCQKQAMFQNGEYKFRTMQMLEDLKTRSKEDFISKWNHEIDITS